MCVEVIIGFLRVRTYRRRRFQRFQHDHDEHDEKIPTMFRKLVIQIVYVSIAFVRFIEFRFFEDPAS